MRTHSYSYALDKFGQVPCGLDPRAHLDRQQLCLKLFDYRYPCFSDRCIEYRSYEIRWNAEIVQQLGERSLYFLPQDQSGCYLEQIQLTYFSAL